MSQITDQLWDKLSWAYFPIFFLAVCFQFGFQRRLKCYHPEAWRALGNPSLFNNFFSKGLGLVSFLFRKNYQPLKDDRLNFYGAGARIGLFAILGFLSLLIILAFVGQYQNGVWNEAVAVQGKPLAWSGAAALGCVASYLISWSFFLARLKHCHRSVWEGLGEPSILNQTLNNSWNTQKFFFGGGYLRLNDATLTIWAVAVWVLGLGCLSLFWLSR